MDSLTLAPQAKEIRAEHLDELISRWLEETASREQISPRTLVAYASHVRPFRRWWQAYGPAHDHVLSRESLHSFAKWLRQDYRTPRLQPLHAVSRELTHTRLRQFLNWLYRNDYSPLPMAAWLPSAGEAKHSPRHVGLDVLPRLLRACADSRQPLRNAAALALLAATGARRAELLAARVENITWHSDGSGAIYLAQTKGNKPRTVIYGRVTGKILAAYLAGRRQGLIFDWQQGDAIRRTLARLEEIAGLPAKSVTPHGLRRLFSSYWYVNHPQDRRAAFMLRLLLGHAPADVTEAHYLTLTHEQIRPHYVAPVETPECGQIIEELIAGRPKADRDAAQPAKIAIMG